MAISRNGRRLLVSASTANVIDVIDTRTGRIVGRIPSGDSPHENNFSRDGSRIFHASIGIVYTDTDDPSQDSTKGERVFEVIDARTLKVLKRIDMGQKLAEAGYPNMSSAVRPMAITPDERYVYFQVSFFFGIVKYDLKADRVVKVLQLPLGAAEGLPRTEFLLDSAHHGLAMNPQGHEAVRRRNDVGLRGDRDPQARSSSSGRSASAASPTGRTRARTAGTASCRSPARTACR